jgi:hypothetical protein
MYNIEPSALGYNWATLFLGDKYGNMALQVGGLSDETVYLQSVQVHSGNWLKEVDECLGEGRSLALFYNYD